jgi:uncharacterized membrane protein
VRARLRRIKVMRRDLEMDEQNKSVGWVAMALFLAVAYFGWVFLAADYFQNDPTDDTGKINVWVNSLTQIPNFPRVISHAVQNRLWMLVLIGVGEVGVVILWMVLRKLERELWSK